MINAHVCVSGGKKCLFFGKFGLLCFLETPVLRFALFPCYRQINLAENGKNVSNDIDLCKIFNCFFSNIASEFHIFKAFENYPTIKNIKNKNIDTELTFEVTYT